MLSYKTAILPPPPPPPPLAEAPPLAVILTLHKAGWRIVGIEQAPDAVDYRKFKSKKPVLFIFGNEVHGVPKSILTKCDAIVEIPMRGKKESLNVSVAAGIILFSAR